MLSEEQELSEIEKTPVHFRKHSSIVYDKLEAFHQSQNRREKSILVNINIDQGEKVSELINRLRKLQGISLFNEDVLNGKSIELTKLCIYLQK